MEDKEAIEILTKMLEKKALSEKEREAVLTAIGILSWSKLGQGRIRQLAKAHKAKLEHNLKGRDTKQFEE